MLKWFEGNAIWQLVMQSDAISKAVLLILFFLSLACWTLFFYKLFKFRTLKKHLQLAIEQTRSVYHFDGMIECVQRHSATPAGYLLSKCLGHAKSLYEAAKSKSRLGLNSDDKAELQDESDKVVDDIIAEQEEFLPLFSATAAISPLLGLFGTVWGLVHAFIRISERQSADIATVAPGIAEALITTLAGLIVAIPALLMFVYLNTQIKHIEQKCYALVDKCVSAAHRSLMH
ncbi:MAG: MotA/TolQ/ExbB proton channel family protein [Candidatus Dependentiae bacterium]